MQLNIIKTIKCPGSVKDYSLVIQNTILILSSNTGLLSWNQLVSSEIKHFIDTFKCFLIISSVWVSN